MAQCPVVHAAVRQGLPHELPYQQNDRLRPKRFEFLTNRLGRWQKRLDPSATKFDEITFMEVVSKDLRVMDLTAITFCKDNGLPILVFDLMEPGNLRRALAGERIGTLVR